MRANSLESDIPGHPAGMLEESRYGVAEPRR